MGVLGLWQLIEPVGQPVNLETLENKVLAIDLSIWLNQVIKGYRDSTSSAVRTAHLQGLFHRICKLLYFKIKPVFVFDGKPPKLKQLTLKQRSQRRSKLIQKSKKTANKVLASYLSTQIELDDGLNVQIEQQDPALLLSSFLPTSRKDEGDEDMFIVPDIPLDEEQQSDRNFLDFRQKSSQIIARKVKQFQSQKSIDFQDSEFRSLSAEIRFEILTQLKERKTKLSNLDGVPEVSNNFSSYQMSRLLHVNSIQREIDKTIEELNSEINEEGKALASESSIQFSYFSKSKRSIFKLLRLNRKDRDLVIKKAQSELQYYDAAEFDFGKSEAIKNDGCSFLKDIRLKKEDETSTNSTQLTKTQSEKEETTMEQDESISSEDPELITGIMSDDDSSDVSVIEETKEPSNSSNIPKSTSIDLADVSTEDDNWPMHDTHIRPISDEDISEQNAILESIKHANESSKSSQMSRVISTHGSQSKTSNSRTEVIELDATHFEMFKEPVTETASQKFYTPPSSPQPTSTSRLSPAHPFVSPPSSPISVTKVPDQPTPVTESKDDEVEWEDDDEAFLDAVKLSQSSAPKSPATTPKKARIEIKTINSPVSLSRADIESMTREANQKERQAEKVSSRMIEECKELLRIFGIPYVLSPAEAESQCAALEFIGLTDGTITDDSDIWLFGACKVYKSFFTDSKYVDAYDATEIARHYKLDREQLIALALLVGSDYTFGVEGVGPITAIEILNEFPGKGFDCLKNFRQWWHSKKTSADRTAGNKLRHKLLKLQLDETFPSKQVYDAYTAPQVDSSAERFSWSRPDLDLIRQFFLTKLGWPQARVDKELLPVLKKLNEGTVQTRIDNFFRPVMKEPAKEIATKSRRLAEALQIQTGDKELTAGPKSKQQLLKEKVRRQRTAGRTRTDRNGIFEPGQSSKGSKNVQKKGSKRKKERLNIVQEVNLSESSSDD